MQQKSNVFLTAKERILIYLDCKGYTQYEFSKKTGLSNGFLKSGSSISSDNLKLLSNNYKDLNILWVITGEGNMLINDSHETLTQSIKGNSNMMAGGSNINVDKKESLLVEELKKQIDNKDNIINNLLKQQESLINQINFLTSKLS